MTILDDVERTPEQAPAQDERLDERVVLLWQMGAALGWLIWVGIAVTALLVLDQRGWWGLLVGLVGIAYVAIVPRRRYLHFRYRVGEVDVRVSHGWLWRTESVVLYSRIQHVDTRQGPLERMAGLSTVVVFTAGSVGAMVAVPGLAQPRAEALRDQLVRLSGTDDAV